MLILVVTTTVFMLAKVYALSLSERSTLGTLSSWSRAGGELALLGIVYGLNERQSVWRALRMGAIDASLGLALVAVKALVG